MYSIKGVWSQHSTDLMSEIPISKCPQARIFSGKKAGRNPLLVKVMSGWGHIFRCHLKFDFVLTLCDPSYPHFGPPISLDGSATISSLSTSL